MCENKRFKVTKSNIIEDAFYIQDKEQEYSFPTTKDASTLVMYEKVFNEQDERIRELEQENKRLKQGKYIYGVHGGSND